jgi:hypothetical protein
MLLLLSMVLARGVYRLHAVWLYVFVGMGHHMATVGVASMPAKQQHAPQRNCSWLSR